MNETNIKRFFSKDVIIMLCLYFGTLLIHVLMSLCATTFNLTPDEYSVAAIAAYINGYDWSSTVSTGGYYGYFQGLFYSPVYLLTDNPALQYKLMVSINSVFMSFAPMIIFYLSRKMFDVKTLPALLFSVICGTYPCYMLLTKYTWNETLCNIMPWVFLLVAYKALECESTLRKQILSVLGGLILVAGYATHGRMLALMAGGIVTVLIVFFVMKKKIFAFTGFFSSIAIGFAADYLLKNFFQDKLWLINELEKTPTNTIEKMFSRILSMDGEAIGNFFRALIGHLFYFITSTWGFGAICIVLIITVLCIYFIKTYKVRKNPHDNSSDYITDNEAILSLFAFLVMGAVFAVSVAFKCTSTVLDERMDTLIYGRYTEVFYPIAIYTALLLIYRCKLTPVYSFGALILAASVNTLTNLFVVPKVVAGSRMVSAMIMGIAPMRYGEGMKDLPTEETFLKLIITNMSMLFVFVIIQLMIKDRRLLYRFFSFPLAALLVYSNIFGYMNYTRPQAKNAETGARYMQDALCMIEDSDSVVCHAIAKERYVKAQFLYPDMEFILTDNLSELNKLTERPNFVVGDREDNLHLWFQDVYLVGDVTNNIQLYACTKEALDYAVSRGYEIGSSGTIHYDGADIPATAKTVRNGSSITMQDNSAVYTNYFTIYKAGTYVFTCDGSSDISDNNITITLTSDSGSTDLLPSAVARYDGKLVIELTASEKLSNVRLKLSNNTGSDVILNSMDITMAEGSRQYALAQGADYTKPVA